MVCNNASTAAVNFTGTGTSYTWTNNETSIGLAASGTGNIAAFTATNSGVSPVTATITVTPHYTNNSVTCDGPTQTFTITVNPTPTLTSTLTPAAICDNSTFHYTPTSATTGTTFAWSRAAVAGISNAAASGTGNPGESLHNTTASPVNVTYVYTLSANGCTNPTTYSVVVTVKPTATLTSSITPPAICDNAVFSYTPTSATTGTTFAWSRAAVAGISNIAATGSGNPNESLRNTTAAPVNVTYVYTLSANG